MPVVLKRSGLVYLRTYRTASSFLIRAFCHELKIGVDDLFKGGVHRAKQVKEAHGDVQCFGFVRHPLAWLQSYWAHQMRQLEITGRTPDQLPGGAFILGKSRLVWSADFNTFARNVARYYPGYVGEVYKHLEAPPNTIPTWIGHYERLFEDLFRFFEQGGELLTPEQKTQLTCLPRYNATASLRRWRDRVKYDNSVATAVARAEQETLTQYGYSPHDF